MAFTFVTTQTQIARNAGILYNLEVGATNMAAYVTSANSVGIDAFLNAAYTASVGKAAASDVATVLLAGLGIPASTVAGSAGKVATDYVVAQLNAVAYTARGAVVNQILNLFSGLTTDAVYGAYATTFNTKVANAVTYATIASNADSTYTAVSSTPLGTAYTLTTGIDTILGTAYDDTINAAVSGVLTGLDNIDGAAGTNTLNVSDTAAIAIPVSATVKNIQTANLTSAATVAGNVSAWTGLTSLTVSEVGGTAAGITAATTTAVSLSDSAQAAGAISISGGSSVTVNSAAATTGAITIGSTSAPTGAVSITRTHSTAVTGGDISVTGGTAVEINQIIANAVNTTATAGTISVSGSANTTSVAITTTKAATASASVAGVNASSVVITDINNGSLTTAGTITSATVSGYTNLGINNNALSTLSVANGSGNIIIDNSGLTTPTNKTLALTANGLTGGTLDDADIYTTLNITTATVKSTLANITFGAVTALTVAGTKGLTLTSATGLSALKTVVVSGSAGITADLSEGTLAATVTAVDTSATTGASKVTIDGSKATFTGGTGADTVTASAATITKALSLGAGDDGLTWTAGTANPTAAISGGDGTDTLGIAAALAATASASATFAGLVTGFEKLTLTAVTDQTIDLAVLGGYTGVTTSGGNGLTLSNLASGGSLTLTGTGTAYTIGNSAFTAGTNDIVNLTLTDDSDVGVAFASTGITASGVETFNITTVDSKATPTGTFNDSVNLLGNSVKTITASGNAGLALTATSTALTSVDASGVAATDINPGFTWTSGALAAAATIKGSATGTNVIDASSATGGAITYTGGTGADSFTANNGKANIITLGNGTNSATVSSGNNTITGGTGADTVIATTGNNTVSLGNGANSFTATTGNNTYTGGTGVDSVSVGGGLNTLTLGTGADVVSLTAVGANVNTYTTITDAHAGVQIAFANVGTETFTTAKVPLAGTAVFQDYANAVIQAGGNASVNGAFGWFQFSGDTYLVESLHDASGVNTSFVNGTDAIIKLSGLIDLSTATGAGTNILTLV